VFYKKKLFSAFLRIWNNIYFSQKSFQENTALFAKDDVRLVFARGYVPFGFLLIGSGAIFLVHCMHACMYVCMRSSAYSFVSHWYTESERQRLQTRRDKENYDTTWGSDAERSENDVALFITRSISGSLTTEKLNANRNEWNCVPVCRRRPTGGVYSLLVCLYDFILFISSSYFSRWCNMKNQSWH